MSRVRRLVFGVWCSVVHWKLARRATAPPRACVRVCVRSAAPPAIYVCSPSCCAPSNDLHMFYPAHAAPARARARSSSPLCMHAHVWSTARWTLVTIFTSYIALARILGCQCTSGSARSPTSPCLLDGPVGNLRSLGLNRYCVLAPRKMHTSGRGAEQLPL
ncbi:hypothetical protein C2E23DRAFT_835084 [Lenzites betulinus]|nr:hypothetical protein C2E23DRAFT_835084 [Lenzites betulinus]